MRFRKSHTDAGQTDGGADAATGRRRAGRGWGPFSGSQLTIIICAFVLAFALPVVAQAAIPNRTTFTGCYAKTGGALRLIDPSRHQTCKSTEAKVTWSQTGPRGAQGVQGVQGIQGPPGANGSARGYGHVASDGTLDPARSFNLAASEAEATYSFSGPTFTFPLNGVYCVQINPFIDPGSVAPVVTADDNPFSNANVSATVTFSSLDTVAQSLAPPGGSFVSDDCMGNVQASFIVVTRNGGSAPVGSDFDVLIP